MVEATSKEKSKMVDEGLERGVANLTEEKIQKVIQRVIKAETGARLKAYVETCVHCGLCAVMPATSFCVERYSVALVWLGALLVFFAQAWEARLRSPAGVRPLFTPLGSLLDWLRRIGVGLSLIGVVTIAL